MNLLDLPPELLIRVLDIATSIHPIPFHVLVLNKLVYRIASPILYKHLYFPSVSAMAYFPPVIWGSETVGKPSTITVKLAGGEVGRGAFRNLWRLLSKTRFLRDVTSSTSTARLELEDLRLCMHSTSDSDADDQTLQALECVNPRRFVWTGPDPAHHFSIAVRAAGSHQSRIAFQHLKLRRSSRLSSASSLRVFKCGRGCAICTSRTWPFPETRQGSSPRSPPCARCISAKRRSFPSFPWRALLGTLK